MTRWTLKLAIFFSSLLIGVFAVRFLLLDQDAPVPIAIEAPRPPIMAANQALPRERKVRAFNPEFTGLPNMGDENVPTNNLVDYMTDGIFRRSEVVAKNGEQWFVLTRDQDNFSLELSTAKVKKLSTISWPGEEKDAKLTFRTSGKPVFGVRSLEHLSAGPVPTVFQRSLHEQDSNGDWLHSEELSDGYIREFVIGKRTYILRTSQGLTKDGTEVAALVLESGETKQVIKSTPYWGENDRDIIGSLLWVGDLDRDGKLDLYFDEFNEKGFTHVELHLSSVARNEALVGVAATFGASGC